MPDKALACFASLLHNLEEGADFPQGQETTLYYQMQKPSGGLRGIGLLPELVRIWERARKPVAEQWQASNRKTYDW